MRTLSSKSCVSCSFVAVTSILSLTLPPAQGADYTWLGVSSNNWAQATNWSGGAYPNGSADTATINLATNNPVQISTAITLGGGTSSSLIIGDNAAATGLDIASGGSLTLTGATAGINSSKAITIEGLLVATYSPYVPPHRPPPPLSIYPISGTGSILFRGGTINGTGTKGAWIVNVPLSGYGTFANRVYIGNTVTVDDGATITITGGVTLQGGTLAANGSGFYANLGSIGGYGTITAPLNPGGTIPNSGGVTTIAANISGGCRIGHGTDTELGGITLTGTSAGHINFDNDSGPVNLTGDLVFSGYVDIGSNGAFNLNGHKITLTYSPDSHPPVVSIISAVTIGTGTIDNATSADLDFSQGPYLLAGGSLTSSGGGAFIRGGIYGWGTITAPIIPCGSAAIVSANSSGQALRILNSVVLTIPTINGNLIATNGGILELGAGSVVTTTGPANFTGYISPGTGTVNLSGTNMVGGTSPIRLNTGAVNVTADSTVGGPIDCAANLTINSGSNLSISGGTATVSLSGGSLSNHGTLTVGAGLLTNSTASAYPLGGNGTVTLAGGSITGTSGFSSTNTLAGFGDINAPFTNNGTVNADVSGSPLVMSGTGPGSIVNAATGIMEATGGGTLSFTNAPDLTNQGAVIAASSSMVQVEGGPLDIGTGNLSGSGTVVGNVSNATGTVSPGASPGSLTIQGNYTQSSGTLSIELGGLAAGTQFDQLLVSGNVSLGGTLQVSLVNGFTPAVGDQYQIITAGSISGTFSTLTLVSFPGTATVSYGPTTVTLRITSSPTGCGTCRGDLSSNSAIDGIDIQSFVSCLVAGSSSGACACADVNGDAQTNLDDVSALVEKLLALAGNQCP